MNPIAVVIIGGGQAGLAVSHHLSRVGVDHVVLEQGRVAERWRSHGQKSLRLLTPNWLNALPGALYAGADPDGFLPATDFADVVQAYATSIRAPVVEEATVTAVTAAADAYLVSTDSGSWSARAVVIATGYADTPAVPAFAGMLDHGIRQLTPNSYRDPDDVPAGGVLVVGASATGVQLADELAAAGRDVVLSVGRHTRVPRRYRGRDIMWWLDAMGAFDRPPNSNGRPPRRPTSLQLVGSPFRDVDLPALVDRGVCPAGRLATADRRSFTFADDLLSTAASADARLLRLLDRIDRFAGAAGLNGAVERPERSAGSYGRLGAGRRPIGRLKVRTVIWATGYRRDYRWLQVPVLDGTGEIVHNHTGQTSAPGLLVAGLGVHAGLFASFVRGLAYEAELVGGNVLQHLTGDRHHLAVVNS